ncbi:hypothetical protein TRFO_19554 [Tritrichomonas foetus]|uniref:Uncharacterized protein n=1 Tax=Tritrichomonas foetus TaxID=1144522 RepID=A0A1J4KME7_9EUKA|nr:hypothetical protein TRFO_19554 [Tritrichomonas foetus]|eukprot:OHT10972.1 hypothetical protein TRFO_19554 [Tritrichomonas foetus]
MVINRQIAVNSDSIDHQNDNVDLAAKFFIQIEDERPKSQMVRKSCVPLLATLNKDQNTNKNNDKSANNNDRSKGHHHHHGINHHKKYKSHHSNAKNSNNKNTNENQQISFSVNQNENRIVQDNTHSPRSSSSLSPRANNSQSGFSLKKQARIQKRARFSLQKMSDEEYEQILALARQKSESTYSDLIKGCDRLNKNQDLIQKFGTTANAPKYYQKNLHVVPDFELKREIKSMQKKIDELHEESASLRNEIKQLQDELDAARDEAVTLECYLAAYT